MISKYVGAKSNVLLNYESNMFDIYEDLVKNNKKI